MKIQINCVFLYIKFFKAMFFLKANSTCGKLKIILNKQ
jgi:hypothetical protein